MNQVLIRVFKKLRTQKRSRARSIRTRTDEIRKKVTAASGAWDSVTILRAIRDGR